MVIGIEVMPFEQLLVFSVLWLQGFCLSVQSDLLTVLAGELGASKKLICVVSVCCQAMLGKGYNYMYIVGKDGQGLSCCHDMIEPLVIGWGELGLCTCIHALGGASVNITSKSL